MDHKNKKRLFWASVWLLLFSIVCSAGVPPSNCQSAKAPMAGVPMDSVWWAGLDSAWQGYFDYEVGRLLPVHYPDRDLNQLTTAEKLGVLASLEKLTVDSEDRVDLSPLTAFVNLKEVVLKDCAIWDLKPLRWTAGSLQKVTIIRTRVSNFNVLRSATLLRELVIADCPDINYSFLSDLPQLKRLSLKDVQVKSFAFLKNLGQLQVLDLPGTNFSDSDLVLVQQHGTIWRMDLSGTAFTAALELREMAGLKYVLVNGPSFGKEEITAFNQQGHHFKLIKNQNN